MTQLATRAALSAMLFLAALVLVLTTAGLFRPDTAAADPQRTSGTTAHTFAKRGKANAHARSAARDRPRAPKAHVKKHARKPSRSGGSAPVCMPSRSRTG